MPIRTITEWQCSRCGNEQAIPSWQQHYWRSLGMSNYQGNVPVKNEPHVSGDLCPDCVGSLIEWWKAGKAPRAKGK